MIKTDLDSQSEISSSSVSSGKVMVVSPPDWTVVILIQ